MGAALGAAYGNDRIVVTATGIISALGTGSAAHLQQILAGTGGLRHPEILRTVHAADFVVGEVPLLNEQLLRNAGKDGPSAGYSRTSLLAIAALHDLMRTADIRWLRTVNLAFINASTVGGMTEIENLYPQFVAPERRQEDDVWMGALDCADSTERAAEFFGIKPQMATISTACSSSANAIIVGARMLRHGLADAVLAGGSDALSRFTLNGFHALKNVDHRPCRPFDADRNGLNLGEGAAYVLLEREPDARRRGAEVVAILNGWCNMNDAYHPTAPSPDGSGALRTMQGALEKAGLAPQDIGYINTHGTATLNNDIAEGRALDQLWDGAPPPFSSTKPFTGHTLAAAGVIEAIISVTSMQAGIIPASLNFEKPMEELSLRPSGLQHGVEVLHVMSNSFGFGGNNVTLILSKP